MADVEIITARLAKLKLRPPKQSKPIRRIVNIVTARLARLMLGATAPRKIFKKARFILKAKFEAIVDKLIKLIPARNQSLLFPELPKVSGVKRRQDETAKHPQEPSHKRQKIELPYVFDLKVFEAAQVVSWEIYGACYDFYTIYNNRPQIASVNKIVTQRYVRWLSPENQIRAYQEILKDVSLSLIPCYIILFAKKVKYPQEHIAREIRNHEVHERRLEKLRHSWRFCNSLRQKALKDGDMVAFSEDVRCWRKRIEDECRELKRICNSIPILRRLERGFLGLVRPYLLLHSKASRIRTYGLCRSSNVPSASDGSQTGIGFVPIRKRRNLGMVVLTEFGGEKSTSRHRIHAWRTDGIAWQAFGRAVEEGANFCQAGALSAADCLFYCVVASGP